MYSSSINDAIATEMSSFTGSTIITNMHPDLASNQTDIPMQGPFTEKFVGGRQHRHIELNRDATVASFLSYNVTSGVAYPLNLTGGNGTNSWNSAFLQAPPLESWVSIATSSWSLSMWVQIGDFNTLGYKVLASFGQHTNFQTIRVDHTGNVLLDVDFAGGGATDGRWKTTTSPLSGAGWPTASSNYGTISGTVSGSASANLVVCYAPGNTDNNPLIYVNGLSSSVQEITTPAGAIPGYTIPKTSGTITADRFTLYRRNDDGSNLAPYYWYETCGSASLSEVSLWSGSLNEYEVRELYNKQTGYPGIPKVHRGTNGVYTTFSPGPFNLEHHSAYDKLVSWWRIGGGTGSAISSGTTGDTGQRADSVTASTGLVFDQKGEMHLSAGTDGGTNAGTVGAYYNGFNTVGATAAHNGLLWDYTTVSDTPPANFSAGGTTKGFKPGAASSLDSPSTRP